MPERIEYLHAAQAALDDKALQYQVLDIDGKVRERLSWHSHYHRATRGKRYLLVSITRRHGKRLQSSRSGFKAYCPMPAADKRR